MANSVITQIREQRDAGPDEKYIPSQTSWHDQRDRDSKSEPLTFTYTFSSKDQAIAVCRMLDHQSSLLRTQANESTGQQIPYVSDVLTDYANILDSMLQEITSTTSVGRREERVDTLT